MLEVSYGAALLAGLVSFVSPCVLPIVPPYLAWLAGITFDQLKDSDVDAENRRRIVVASAAFVLGFSTVFVALGATASTVGKLLARYYGVLSVGAGVAILIMGLHFLGVFRIGLLFREARVQVERKPAGAFGAYVMGLAFAFGWTPCVGPVLAAILFVAGSEGSALKGAALLAAYSLGIGLPFLLAALFASRFLDFAARFRRHMGTVEKVMGAMLVVTGILFMTGSMSAISQWILETFPTLATVG
jgi:cytochrome c-type biogenesis protein